MSSFSRTKKVSTIVGLLLLCTLISLGLSLTWRPAVTTESLPNNQKDSAVNEDATNGETLVADAKHARGVQASNDPKLNKVDTSEEKGSQNQTTASDKDPKPQNDIPKMEADLK